MAWILFHFHGYKDTVMFLVCEKADNAVASNSTAAVIIFFMPCLLNNQHCLFVTDSFDKSTGKRFNGLQNDFV